MTTESEVPEPMPEVLARFVNVNKSFDTILNAMEEAVKLLPLLTLKESEVDALTEEQKEELRFELNQHAEMCEFIIQNPLVRFLTQHRTNGDQSDVAPPIETVELMQTFKHYKGGIYRTVNSAINSNTGVVGVIYTCAKSGTNYWLSNSEFNKQIETVGVTVPRFTKIDA